jgi:hypothetical protein
VKLTELLATIEARMGAPVLAPAKP